MTNKQVMESRIAINDINHAIQRLKEFEPNSNISNAIANAEMARDFVIDEIEASDAKDDKKAMYFYVSEKGVKLRNEFIATHKCSGLRNCSYKFVPTGIGEVVYFSCGCGDSVMIEDDQ